MRKVIICLPGDTFSAAFFSSFLRLEQWMNKNKVNYTVSMAQSSNIYRARNLSFQGDCTKGPNQFPFNGEAYDYILMIDSDQVFDGEALGALMNKNAFIIGAAVRTQDMKYIGAGMIDGFPDKMNVAKPLLYQDIKAVNDIMTVSYIGFGFTLIKQGVVEQLTYPWFTPELVEVNGISDIVTDDVSFCRRVSKLDIPILLDTRVRVGHEKPFVI